MSITRKIRMFALAVIIGNGAVALTMLPTPALATSCGPILICIDRAFCADDGVALCETNTPPGCTYSAANCTSEYCVGGYNLICQYT